MNLPTATLRPYSEEVVLRQAAVRFAGQSQNTAFVPALIDLLSDPAHVRKAREEFDRRRGANFVYRSRLDRDKPALDYRKGSTQ